jgi:polysaccharide pyruvyl transferase WcaK-like protein
MPNRKNQILLIRNIFSNVGDEAMLACEIAEIRRAFPLAALKVLTDDPPRIARLYKVEADFSDVVLTTPFSREKNRFVHNNFLKNDGSLKNSLSGPISDLSTRFLLPMLCRRFVAVSRMTKSARSRVLLPEHQQKLLNDLNSARLVIGGGGLIPSITGIFLPKRALYKSLSALGVPYILHGQTVLPEGGAEAVYRSAARVLLRDREFSRQTALKFGAAPENLIEKLDPAFDLAAAPEERLDSDVLRFIQKPFFAVNLREWKNGDFSGLFADLAEVFDKFHRLHQKVRIVFFPMQEYGTDHDLTAINKLRKPLNPEIESLTLSADIRPEVLKSILGKAFAVITGRYHGAVFGLSAAVPTIGISVSAEYDVKLKGILSMFAADDFLVSARRAEKDKMFVLLKRILEDRPQIISDLQSEKEKLRNLPELKDVLTEVWRQPDRIKNHV